jgi:hypothetical protein
MTTALRDQLTGTMALPGEPGYELAESWNRAVTIKPAAVVAVADAADVAGTVRFAGAHGLRVAVQATGHGAVPLGEDVLLIHTGRLDRCTIQADDRTARIGAGVLWQQVIEAAAPHGLTPVAGSSTSVGVVGYLTGGGIGPLAATFGVSSDYVRAFDVVTGDGESRHVTATEHPDLFWGLRGGKSTLGIVTDVEIDLLSLTNVYGGSLFFDGADASAVLHAWATWSATLPDHATTSVALLKLPDVPQLPPAISGKRTISVRYASVRHTEEALAPIRTAATPVLGAIGELPVTELGTIHADPARPMPVHERQTLLAELPADAVEALLAAAGPDSNTPVSVVELRRLGGAIARPAQHPSAVDHREAPYALSLMGLFSPEVQEAAAQTLTDLAKWSTGGRLPNFAPSADPAETAKAYTNETHHRLATLARQYDPNGTLAVGQTVR